MTLHAFLAPHVAALRENYAVTVVANLSNGKPGSVDPGDEIVSIPIERRIAPLRDLAALAALVRLFRQARFAVVQSVTPKAGLLAMLAGWLTRVPVRIHIFTGQVWATRRGLARWFLKRVDRLIAGCATHVLVDSPTQRDFLLAEGVISADKSRVLGKGSISGVDSSRFKPDPKMRADMRRQLGYRDNDVVFMYLGRVNRDKGMLDLAAAFARVAATSANVRLLAVGPDEGDIHDLMLAALGNAAAQAEFIDFTDRPQDYMAAADVFCLPSYREGFGTVIIEAAACGVPAIASRIYGVTDAVVDSVTGILHAPGDIAALTAAMTRLAWEPQLRRELGDAARHRALADFQMPALTSALLGFYAKILN